MRVGVERFLWLLMASGAAAMVLGRWRPPNTPPAAGAEGALVLSEPSHDSVNAAAAAVIANDPFRLERKPASLRFGESPPQPPPQTLTAPAPVRLTLSGTIGPPWQAIVEGIPGRTGGTVVRAGEAYGSLRIVSVGRDTIVVQGADSTWTITLKQSGR